MSAAAAGLSRRAARRSPGRVVAGVGRVVVVDVDVVQQGGVVDVVLGRGVGRRVPAVQRSVEEPVVGVVDVVRRGLVGVVEAGLVVLGEAGLVDLVEVGPVDLVRARLAVTEVLGEPEVGYWHELEAGFAGRKKLMVDATGR